MSASLRAAAMGGMLLADAVLDLFTGGSCVGCATPGRLLCRDCSAGLPQSAMVAWPTPCPPGLAPPLACGEYADLLREMVIGHKEHRLLGLRRPLGALVATAVRAVVSTVSTSSTTGGPGSVVLVPVPSRAATVRARGHDPTYSITREAARVLRGEGLDALAHRLLLSRGPVQDQAGLDSGERSANLAGSMHCPGSAIGRLRARRAHASVIICDDVLTTGSTAREAQRALEAVGFVVSGIATVAATRKRTPVKTLRGDSR